MKFALLEFRWVSPIWGILYGMSIKKKVGAVISATEFNFTFLMPQVPPLWLVTSVRNTFWKRNLFSSNFHCCLRMNYVVLLFSRKAPYLLFFLYSSLANSFHFSSYICQWYIQLGLASLSNKLLLKGNKIISLVCFVSVQFHPVHNCNKIGICECDFNKSSWMRNSSHHFLQKLLLHNWYEQWLCEILFKTTYRIVIR